MWTTGAVVVAPYDASMAQSLTSEGVQSHADPRQEGIKRLLPLLPIDGKLSIDRWANHDGAGSESGRQPI